MQEEQLHIVQGLVLSIATQVVDVCERAQIPYYLIEGSLLGAVRHGTIIPWDDDIDFAVPREDYDRLVPLLEDTLKPPYHLCQPGEGKPLRAFTQVECDDATVCETQHIRPLIRSVWVDIFPLDGAPHNLFLRKLHWLRVMYRRLRLQVSQFDVIVDQKKQRRPWYERILLWGARRFFANRGETEECMQKLVRTLRKYSCGQSDWWINAMTAYKTKCMMPQSWYGDGKPYSFAGHKWNGPVEADAVLTYLYGDYMQLPPLTQRDSHHLQFIENNSNGDEKE